MKKCDNVSCLRTVGAYGDRWCSRCRFNHRMAANVRRPVRRAPRGRGGGVVSNPETSVDAFIRSGQRTPPR